MNDKRSKGRPGVVVEWPENQFTAEEIHRALDGTLSRVSVHAKINRAVSAGQLICVGKIKPRTGRPKILYQSKSTEDQQSNQ